MPLNPSEDAQFEKLARTLAPSVRKRSAKAVKSAFDRSPFDMDADLLEPAEEDEYDDTLFIRDFLNDGLGRGLAVDYGLAWEFAAKDLGEGQVSLVDSRGVTGTFTRATTATTVDRTGKIVTVASGVARSYYDPTTLEYLGYLAEGARTNLCLQSEDFSTTWTAARAAVATNSTTAPDGNATADKLTEDTTAANTHQVSQLIAKAASSLTYSQTIFVKQGSGTRSLRLAFTDNAGNGVQAYFDISAGTVLSTSSAFGAGFTAGAANITAFSNGWYRCEVTGTTNTALVVAPVAGLANGTSGAYDGDGASSLYLWGAQLEAASFASSYIPTTTVAVARNADVLTWPTAGWLNAAGGTVFAEWSEPPAGADALFSRVWCLQDGTENNRILISCSGGGTWTSNIVTGGVTQSNITSAELAAGTIRKNAFAFSANDLASSFDGGAVGTDTSASIPTVTTIALGKSSNNSNQLFGPIARVAYYNQRVPNAVLQAFTA